MTGIWVIPSLKFVIAQWVQCVLRKPYYPVKHKTVCVDDYGRTFFNSRLKTDLTNIKTNENHKNTQKVYLSKTKVI